MKNAYIIFYVALACIGILGSCKRDKCPDVVTQHDTLKFTASELSKVPYTGYDTLCFLNKQGDTCIIKGTGKRCSYETQIEASGMGCGPEKITYYPTCTINFIPIKGDLEFTINMSKKEWSIIIESSKYQRWFYMPFFNTGIPRSGDSDYIESVIINEKQYTVVRNALGYSLNAVNPDSSINLLYNIDYGVLQLQNTITTQNYTLIN